MALTKFTKLTPSQYDKIIYDAFIVAKHAEDLFRSRYGEPMYCGFAWVHIDDARDPFVKYFRSKFPDAGHHGHPKGWDIWNPGGSYTQSMEVKEQGAEAFAKVLRDAGINAYAQSRAD